MRDVATVGTFLAMGLFVFGLAACSNAGLQSSFPVGPSGIGRDLSPGPGATFATDHTLPPDDVFEDINPCTGATIEVTQHYVRAVFRPGGGFSVVADVTTSDGFSGRLTFAGNDPSAAGKGGVVRERATASATARDGSGRLILYTANVLLVMKDGNIIVDRDEENFRCLGKPVA